MRSDTMNYQVVIVTVGMLKSFPLHSSGFVWSCHLQVLSVCYFN